MNDRCFAQVLMLRVLRSGEFWILLIAVVALATAAGASARAAMIAADPVAARLVNATPSMIFGCIALGTPLFVVSLAAADRDAGWTAPVFAGSGSPATYVVSLTAGVSFAAAIMINASLLAFHAAARSLGFDVIARMLTGTLSLCVLCAYAVALWVILYDRSRTFIAMLLLWFGPLAIGIWLAIARGAIDQPLWSRILLLLVPPVRMSTVFTPAMVQAAYIALLAAALVALSPRRVPVWR